MGDLEVAVSLLAQISESAGEFGSEESSADDGDVGGRLGHRVEAPEVLDFAEKSGVIGDRIASGSQRRNRSGLRCGGEEGKIDLGKKMLNRSHYYIKSEKQVEDTQNNRFE